MTVEPQLRVSLVGDDGDRAGEQGGPSAFIDATAARVRHAGHDVTGRRRCGLGDTFGAAPAKEIERGRISLRIHVDRGARGQQQRRDDGQRLLSAARRDDVFRSHVRAARAESRRHPLAEAHAALGPSVLKRGAAGPLQRGAEGRAQCLSRKELGSGQTPAQTDDPWLRAEALESVEACVHGLNPSNGRAVRVGGLSGGGHMRFPRAAVLHD